MLYKKILKPLVFRMDPEKAHELTVNGMRLAGAAPGASFLMSKVWGGFHHKELTVEAAGLSFPSPVGLAAGLDKNAGAVRAFSSIGFGFVEVGTVTPRPQLGNEKPRLFRLPSDGALINRMGFNNVGIAEMGRRLDRLKKHPVPIGVNIGKNKDTPNELAEQDYRKCLKALYPYGDFFVVNISSPNTPNLRSLQHGKELRRLITAVQDEIKMQGGKKPVFIKIAPDLTDEELASIVDVLIEHKVSGIIATNTTIRRSGLTHYYANQGGGLSGQPLRNRATNVIRSVYRRTQGSIPIIGCGGIFSAADAYEKIRAGASLVEIYTALIYEGPELLKRMQHGIYERMVKDGFTHISQAVGTAE